jgi:glycosyltransferase involved in cell wall biosynthesis
MVTQKVDLADDLLGFTHGWIEAFSDRMEKVYVSAIRIGDHRLAEKAALLPMETGRDSRAGRCVNLIRGAGPLLLNKEVDLVFVHMSPVFSLLLAPFAAAAGVPQVLWYTHGSAGAILRAALWTVDRVVTASADDFPLASHKVTGTGHGIDCGFFCPAGAPEENVTSTTILSVGRISPVKNYELMLDAFGRVPSGYQASLTLVGEAGTPAQEPYLEKIRTLAASEPFKDRILLAGKVPHRGIRAFYRRSRLMINLSDTGTLDKAVLEAMACGVPVVTTNSAFETLLRGIEPGLFVARKDPSEIAAAIEGVLALSLEERDRLGLILRERVTAQHDLGRLAGRLLSVFEEVAKERGI